MCLQHNKKTKDVTTRHTDEVIQYKDHFSLVPKSNAKERISQNTPSSYQQPYSIAYCA